MTEKKLKATGDVSIANKKYNQLTDEETELKDKQSEYEDNKDNLNKERDALRREIDQQKKIMDDKDKIIQEKENRIYHLKKRTQELEKFKFVLDYKIKELKRDIGPREKEISDMKDETNEMDTVMMDIRK